MKIYPMIDKTDKHTIEKKEIPNVPFRMILNASSGAGKSSLLGWLMCNSGEKGYKSNFKKNNIFVFSGSLKGDEKLKKMIEFLEIEDDNLFAGFDNDILNELYDQMVDDFNEDSKKEHKLFIFDDLGYTNTMNKRQEESAIDRIFCNGRKFLVSCFVLHQRVIQANRTCLANASSVILYKPNNNDLDIYESNFNYLDDKKQFKKMVRQHTKGKHDFMVVDFSKSDIYRNKNFEPIKICECGKGKNDCGNEKFD
jgi:hypothetical protein